MKKLTTALAFLALAVLTSAAMAQPPGGERGQRGPGGREGGGRAGGPGGGNPIIAALDADRDGVLSAKEIENAAVALKALDKNKDGKLSREEIAPPRGRGGNFAGRGGGAGTGGFMAFIMQNDKNKDGKITKDELPERMARLMERGDTNKDGTLDKKELEAMASQIGNRGGGNRQGGAGGRPGGGRGRPGDGGGDRPERPKRPTAEDK